jgi:hypothetical protein
MVAAMVELDRGATVGGFYAAAPQLQATSKEPLRFAKQHAAMSTEYLHFLD